MPLTLLIESELDERSATAAANRAERVYAEASQNISKSMSSQIGDGARESSKAVEKMADSARDSYKKVLAAQDELAQQEKLLKQMREEGARGVEVQAERVRQARKAEKDAIRESAAALNEYERAATRVSESGGRAGAALRQGLREGIQNGLSDVTSQFGALGALADTAFAGISSSGGIAALGVAGVGLAAVAAAQQLYQLGSVWDSVGDNIAMRTGKYDDDLQGITDSVKRVASDTAASIDAIGEIAGQVVQSMKLTGPELDVMTQRLAMLQEAGNPVGVRDLARAYNVFGIETKDQVDTLDRLFNVSQNTGIPMQELVATLTQAGRAAKQFGLDASSTAGLLSTLEQAGLSSESASKSLTIALKNFSKEGRDAGPALTDTIQRIQDLADAHRDDEAAMLAASTFGGKSYLDMLNAIKDHRLTADDLSKPFDAAGKSIPEAAQKTEDFAEEWQKLKNNISIGLEPAASSVFDGLNSAFEVLISNARAYRAEWDKMFGNGGDASAPADPGTLFGGGGGFDGGPDPSTGLTGARAGGTFGAFSRPDPGWGYKDSAGGSKSAQSSPEVPYAPGYGRAPLPGESAAMYGAEQNVLEAQHRRATAEAVLAQVMANATHTTNDEIKAQNDLAQARKGEIDANLRLRETAAKAAESLNKATGQMSDFGAAIDADFGASKGLPGIIENVTKMLGNLALAGPMAQMNALSQANPNQGSGLMGMLASNGVFGQQYTPQAIAASSGSGGYSPSALGLVALQPGAAYPGDAALLANVPRGIGQYDNTTKDLSRGLVDCASGVEDLVNILDGKSTTGGSLWTGNAASVLPQMGFLPGMGGPGDFRIGYRNGGPGGGHMQATLPGGTNVNFGSTEAIQAGGQDGSLGAYDPSFTSHYYRPMGTPASTSVAPAPSGPSWINGSPAATPGNYSPPPQDQLTNPGLSSPSWQGPGLNPRDYSGGGGQSPVFNNASGPGIGGAAGQSDPFGVAPTAGPGGGGIGITPGGTVDTAIGIAAAAGNMFAPGAGAAAQAGMKLASRAIQYGGTVAGIAADGLLQTFLPQGSEKAGAGWLQRGVGALASVKPALPNLAGGKGSPKVNPQDQQSQQPGQPPVQGGDTNITVNNQRATEDGTGKDIAFHLGAQNSAPGW